MLTGEAADVLLVDIGLPDGSGLEVIQQARLSWPACEVMVISVFSDRKKYWRPLLRALTATYLKT